MSRSAAPEEDEEEEEEGLRSAAELVHDGWAKTGADRGSQRDDRAGAERAGSQEWRLALLERAPELAVEVGFEVEVELDVEVEIAFERAFA
jgi:hypothetical protein